MDLSLISIEELLNECEKRCSSFIVAYKDDSFDEKGQELKFKHGNGSNLDAVGISSILHDYCLNNWNGELNTLQKINEGEGDGNG